MKKADLLTETVATYSKHGWQLRKILLTPESVKEMGDLERSLAPIMEAPFDGVWFSRPSRGGREAWELRLLESTPYALFENFEPEETEEQRDEMRHEMETRMKQYVGISD